MIDRTSTVETWWDRVQRLHEQIVTHWVRCRTARQPLALESSHLSALLSSSGVSDLAAPVTADQEGENAVSRIGEQLLWGLRKINQFRAISQTEHQALRETSQQWFSNVRRHWAVPLTEQALAEIQNATLTYLQKAESVCSEPSGPRPVSGEYSAEVQLKVLHLSTDQIGEPILDIGCGREATLVRWLRSQRINAIGIDLCGDPSRGCIACDWFQFPFVPEYFGTIVAHLSFTLHFLRHHLDDRNGDAEQFAKQYMSILRSLRVGGRMVYTPGLPFIERLLPASRYRVTRYPVEGFTEDSQAAEVYAQQLGEDPIYACHVERL